MALVFGALLFCLVAAFVLWPVLRGEGRRQAGEDPEVADLEARKEAKYREIRDTELDHAAGKLSEEDFRHQDAQLRTEAVELLDRLEEAERRVAREAPSAAEPDSP